MSEDHPPEESLSEIAQSSVRHAVTRGRKRRALPPQQNGSVRLAVDDTRPTDRSAAPLYPVPYHKRRKTSLIPHADAHSDDDSNDEWEEHVHIDEQLVRAAAAASLKNASSAMANPSAVAPPTTTAEPQPQPQQRQQLTDQQLRRLQRKLAAENRKSRQRVHTIHLLLLIAHMLRQDIAADNHLVRALALSIMPPDTWLTPEKGALKQQLATFALWTRLHFHTSVFVTQNGPHRPHNSFKRPCNAAERLIACIQRCKGDIIDVATLACALVRAHGLRCRLVLALQLVPTRARTSNKEQQLSVRRQLVQASVKDLSESCLFAWIEVWCNQQNTWIVVDVYGGQVSERFSGQVIEHSLQRIPSYGHNVMQSYNVQHTPSKATSTPRRSRRAKKQDNAQEDAPVRHLKQDCFAHVVAVEKGLLRDVSRRYVRNWLQQVEACRASGKLFENVLNNLQASCCSDSDEALQHESQEFESLTAEEKVPTTLTAVQKHPRYVLERHIKRYEVIWPKQPIVGYIKDEPIFLRANVRLLHTKDRWIREMRQVKAGSKPMKSVKSKNGMDSQVHLFGGWQTQALAIPPCKDGKVPRGQHGNVDLWTPDHLPVGAVHINIPHARVAATKVGVDFAPAMTGFDVRGGRSVPRIEGVVIAVENADLVRDAAREVARMARERAEKREREEALVRWAKLLRAVKAGQRVKKEYGGFDNGGTYESEQKRQGALKAALEKNGVTGLHFDTGTGKQEERTTTNGKLKMNKKNHEHDFDEPRHVEEDTWVKTCRICELEVRFEKL